MYGCTHLCPVALGGDGSGDGCAQGRLGVQCHHDPVVALALEHSLGTGVAHLVVQVGMCNRYVQGDIPFCRRMLSSPSHRHDPLGQYISSRSWHTHIDHNTPGTQRYRWASGGWRGVRGRGSRSPGGTAWHNQGPSDKRRVSRSRAQVLGG